MASSVPHWFLVKRNWPGIKARFPHYAGLGGEVWPFNPDGTTDKQLRDLHSRMDHSRTIVDFGLDSGFVCTDATIAEEYFAAMKAYYGEAWLVQASLQGGASSQTAGFDIGFATGGYSVIETELMTEGMEGPSLNEWGLIETLPEALAYLDARKDNERLEQLDEIIIISIDIIHEDHSA